MSFDSLKAIDRRIVVNHITKYSCVFIFLDNYTHADRRLSSWGRYINATVVSRTVRSHVTDGSRFLEAEVRSIGCHTTNDVAGYGSTNNQVFRTNEDYLSATDGSDLVGRCVDG